MEKLKSADIILGVVDTGIGKPTFGFIIEENLKSQNEKLRVVRFTPEDTGPLTRPVWRGFDRIYNTPSLQSSAGGHRANGKNGLVDRAVLTAANRGVLPLLEESDGVFATVHALFGKDMRRDSSFERVVVDGDYQLEPMAVGPRTDLLVTTEDTKKQAFELAKERGIKQDVTVTGFLVPSELLDEQRPHDLIDLYSQGPTIDKPLRISYMMTGQGAHLPELEAYILHDKFMGTEIRHGRIQVDVFTARSSEKAQIAAEMAREAGMSFSVSSDYDPNYKGNVQVIWASDPQDAVRNSFALAANGHLLMTPAAERIAWAGLMPYVPLPPVKGNGKMEGNGEYLEKYGLTGPTSGIRNMKDTLSVLFGRGGRFVEEHFERAHDVFDGKLDGGAKAAAHIIEVYNQRKAA